MNEAVDRLISERQRLDAGLPGMVLVSIVGHLLLIGGAVALPLLLPRQPLLRVSDFGFAVVLPRGGGGSPTATAPPADAPVPAPRAAPQQTAAPPPPPKVLKPPKEEPRPNALPTLDARRIARRAPEPAAAAAHATAGAPKTPAGGAPGGRGSSSATPGLEFAPPGPGIPSGSDTGGDWYLAGVQQKIWMLWRQQLKAGFTQPVGVAFTIQPDGSVTDVRVTEPSGATLLDMAAQRAVLNAAPFGPLPKEYGQHPTPIRALFKPTP